MRGRPLYPLLLVVLPTAAFLLLWVIFSAGTVRELPVAVIDLDDTSMSRQLVRMVDSSPSMAVTERGLSGIDGEHLLLSGEVYAVLLIPRDLERDLLRGSRAVVTLYRNSQLLLPSSLIRREVLTVVGTLSAGIEIRQREARGEAPAAARERLEPILVQSHPLFNPWLNYMYFLVSSLLPAVLQIFVLVTAVHAVGVELKEGSGPDWLAASGGSVARAVAGKLLPYTAAHLILAAFMLTMILGLIGAPLHGDLPALVVGTVLFVLAGQALGATLAAWFASLRLATSAAAFIATPAFAFAGLTFPTSAMPLHAQAWGELLPLTHYLEMLVEQVMRGAPVAASAPELLALASFVLVVPLLGHRRLARVLAEERFWGRP